MTRATVSVALAALVTVAAPSPLYAQDESRFASDLRREGEHLRENCSELRRVPSCAYTIVTDYPFHLAMGSLAPGNGFSFGLAFVERYTPNESWRISWNADAVRAFGGSYRAGVYMKLIHTPTVAIGVGSTGAGGRASSGPSNPIREYPVFNIYAQTLSLEEALFFGLGNATAEGGRAMFSERQTIIGSSVIHPIGGGWLGGLRPSLVGAVNGRFMRVRANGVDDVAPIDLLYGDIDAPGLADESTAFVQFEEGVRFKPSLANGRVRFNYLVSFQQYAALGDSDLSFRRWNLDLNHEFPIYRTAASPAASDTNGPNECFVAVGSNTCPEVTLSRNRTGAVNVRAMVSSAAASGANRVPFYFQRTLGGRDINGERLLASFDNYRFRGPQLIAFQQSLEHSLWGPIGAYVLAEQGKVATARGDLNLSDLRTSYAVGLTIRAGGLPMINFSFAWGEEGNHLTSTIDTTLLGGSSRPSLH
jgi:hypothetical protein